MDILIFYKELIKWIPYLLAYLYAIIIGHFLTKSLIDQYWNTRGIKSIKDDLKIIRFKEHPAMIGALERTLYIITIISNKPEFIGLWLTLKVAGQWGIWTDKEGRTIFNIFLIGNALSILFAVIGASIVKWLQGGEIIPVFAVMLFPIALIIWGKSFKAR